MSPRPLARRSCAIIAVLLLAFALGACSSDDSAPLPPSGPVTTVYRGVFAGNAAESGTMTLDITVQTALLAGHPARFDPPRSLSGPLPEAKRETGNVTGTVKLSSGGSAPLDGTYEPATGGLHVSGGGFVFTGTLSNGEFVGGYTRGANRGGFVAILPQIAFAGYCGTWTGSDAFGNPDAGTVSLIVDAATVYGVAVREGGTISQVTGSATSSEVIFVFPSYRFEGTITGPEIRGSYVSTIAARSGGWTAALTPF